MSIAGPLEFDGTNVRHYGAKGDGVTDDTAAIQAAHDAAFTTRRWPVFFPPVASGKAYIITAPILFRSDAWFRGSGADGLKSPIYMQSTNMAHDAFRTNRTIYGSSAGSASRARFENMRIIDFRDPIRSPSSAWTDPGGSDAPTRTGVGINFSYVFNLQSVAHCYVSGFYDNIVVGNNEALNGDCIEIESLWLDGFARYGVNAVRVANGAKIERVKADIQGTLNASADGYHPTAVALINIENVGIGSPIRVENVKFECGQPTTDNIRIASDASPNITLKDITTRGRGSRDVVRILSDNPALTLENITAGSIATGYSLDSAVNLLNHVNDAWTVPLSASYIAHMVLTPTRERVKTISAAGATAMNRAWSTVIFTSTSAASTTLFAAARCIGLTITFVNAAASGTKTINAASGETINGVATYNLTTQYQAVRLLSTGTAWVVIP